jgi:hypothetical protein
MIMFTWPKLTLHPERPATLLDVDALRSSPAKFQFTIGKGMAVVAVFAVVFAITPTALAAAAISTLIVFYSVIYWCSSNEPSLPRRRRAKRCAFPDDLL